MEIHYECTAEDYADAQIAHMKSVGMYWVFLAVVPAFLVVGIVMFSKNPIFSLLQFVLAAGFFLWVLVFFPAHAKRDFKKHPHLGGAKLLRADEDGLRMEGDSAKSELSWSLISKFRETPRTLMLYVGARNFIVIPKLNISPNELEQFRTLLRLKRGSR